MFIEPTGIYASRIFAGLQRPWDGLGDGGGRVPGSQVTRDELVLWLHACGGARYGGLGDLNFDWHDVL